MTNSNVLEASASNGTRKRLSLDVFKEKAIGSEANLEQTGGTSWVCSIISIISIAITISSDTSGCCSSDDCHPQK